MAEKPIVHTEPDNATVDLNMQVTGPKEKAALDASFENFFKEVDAAEPPPAPVAKPPASEPGAKVEPQPEKKIKPPSKKAPDLEVLPEAVEPKGNKAGSDSPTQKPIETPKDATPPAPDEDAEIDALPAPTHPKAKQDWERLRDHGKKNKALAKAYEDTFGDLAKEYEVKLPKTPDEAKEFLPKLKEKINEDRKRPAPKEILEELEQNKQIVRKLGIDTNQQFAKEYIEPTVNSFKEVIDDTAGALIEAGVAKDVVDKWSGELKDKFAPDKVGYRDWPNKWWQESVLNQIPDEFKRNVVFQKIQNHLNLQKKLRDKNQELVGSADKFKAYNDEQLKNYNTWFYNEQFDEVSKTAKAIEDIHEWGVEKDLTGITDVGKRKEIEEFNAAHKPIYDKTLTEFKKWVNRLAGQVDPDEPNITMPRWQGRAAMEIMKALRLKEKYETAVQEIAELKSKLAKHEVEANKRARVQSIPARPSSSGTVKAKPVTQQKLGRNVRDVFEDWNAEMDGR